MARLLVSFAKIRFGSIWLYVGTETGVFVSFDDGENWGRLQSNLPVVPVYDMVVKDNELVIATHGRSFWILDDLTPLRQLTDEVTQGPVHLFEHLPPIGRYLQWSARGFRSGTGKNYMVGLGAAATFYEDKLSQGDVLGDILMLARDHLPALSFIIYSRMLLQKK